MGKINVFLKTFHFDQTKISSFLITFHYFQENKNWNFKSDKL